jgi:hypothetical protein
MKSIFCIVVVSPLSLSLMLPSFAQADSGSVELIVSAQSTNYAVQMGDATVTARGGTGTVTFRQGDGPFADTSGTAQYASFSKKTPTGFELEADGLATFGSGETLQLLFKRRMGDLAAGTSGEGTLQLTGDSGRFAGVSGQCKYRVDNLPGNWNVTVAKCNWKN